jgi:hypothetical protein
VVGCTKSGLYFILYYQAIQKKKQYRIENNAQKKCHSFLPSSSSSGLPGEAGGEAAGTVLALLQVQGEQAQLDQRTVRVPAG